MSQTNVTWDSQSQLFTRTRNWLLSQFGSRNLTFKKVGNSWLSSLTAKMREANRWRLAIIAHDPYVYVDGLINQEETISLGMHLSIYLSFHPKLKTNHWFLRVLIFWTTKTIQLLSYAELNHFKTLFLFHLFLFPIYKMLIRHLISSQSFLNKKD